MTGNAETATPQAPKTPAGSPPNLSTLIVRSVFVVLTNLVTLNGVVLQLPRTNIMSTGWR